jgi:hypothetical protein
MSSFPRRHDRCSRGRFGSALPVGFRRSLPEVIEKASLSVNDISRRETLHQLDVDCSHADSATIVFAMNPVRRVLISVIWLVLVRVLSCLRWRSRTLAGSSIHARRAIRDRTVVPDPGRPHGRQFDHTRRISRLPAVDRQRRIGLRPHTAVRRPRVRL